MLQLSKLMRILSGLAVACAAGLMALPAAGDVFAWRTEDGTYAFADDEEHVPARYAAQARRVSPGSLEGYARYTEQDAAASQRYAERLASRLAYLRQLNAPAQASRTAASVGQGVLSIPTGDEDSPRVELPLGEVAGSEPVVVEPILTKRTGDARTRRATVVRRGDEVVALIQGMPHVVNPSTDIHDVDEIERGEALSR